MKRFILLVVLSVAVSSVFCGKASAQDHVHDGFFLRLAPGLGNLSASEEVGKNKIEWSGMSGLFNFAIGGAITENLILHLDASGISTSDPKIKINGRDQVIVADTTASGSLVGIGLTYYFPSNIYITGALGIAESKFKVNGIEYSSDKGYGTNIMIGKEWWASANWGLGIAGQFIYTICPDKTTYGDAPDIKATSLGVLFSATYN